MPNLITFETGADSFVETRLLNITSKIIYHIMSRFD